MARQLAESVTLYTNGSGEVATGLRSALGSSSIKVDSRVIKQLIKEPEDSKATIQFDDGQSKTEGFLVHRPKNEINGPFAKDLGLEMTLMGNIRADPPFYGTSLPGVFAIGDCGSMFHTVGLALANGGFAAAGVVAQLQAEAAL